MVAKRPELSLVNADWMAAAEASMGVGMAQVLLEGNGNSGMEYDSSCAWWRQGVACSKLALISAQSLMSFEQ
jgi:hypothetical protein